MARRPSSTLTSTPGGSAAEQPEVGLDHPGVDLGDATRAARPRLRQPARQRQPAGAEVVAVQRLADEEGRVDDRRHRLHVGELEVGRVLEVDVGVPQAVEHEHPSAGPLGIDVDRKAVVGRLDVAAARCRGRPDPGQRHDQGQHRVAAAATARHLHQDRRHQEQHAEAHEDPAHRDPRHQHEARDDRADDGPHRADARQASDDGAGLGEAGQPELDHDGGHGRQQHAGDQDREGGREQQQARRARGSGTADHRRGERHGRARDAEQRPEQRARRDPVGGPPAGPRARGDGGQGQPDDERVGLERQPVVGREQPQRHELDHQDRR